MKKIFDNLITYIIAILIITIIIGIILFCLDVLGIVTIPEKYSLYSMLNSNIESRVAVGAIVQEKVITEDFDTIVRKKKQEEKEAEKQSEEDEDVETNIDEVFSNFFALNEEMKREQEQNQNQSKNVEFDETDTNRFYYSQLDTYGKTIYDKLYSNKDKFKSGTYTADFGTTFNDLLHQDDGTDILYNSFQLAINALTFDNPEFFYIDVTKIYLQTEITTRAFSKTYRVSIGGNGSSYLSDSFQSSDIAMYSITSVEQIKNTILSECEGLSTIDKIRYVNNYLIDNTEYDIDAGENIYNIYGTLIDKKAVCEGYARSTKYILDAMDIPCIIACGIGKNSAGVTESHAWNYIKVDGVWYALDVTWNDPVFVGGVGRVTDDIRYRYFLNGSNKFFEDHFEDGNIVGDSNFQYPKLSVLNYK